MDDKSIRKILIAYLKAKNKEIRIYQEKSIGSSICDVMAVKEYLVGYEIKSDRDNYERLPDQIKSYDQFFEMNYLVVSERHRASAPDKVPYYWGILCIYEDRVDVVRYPRVNSNVSRRKQLSILWKLELKNILIKNNMPLYAQREKGFIADRIAEYVQPNLLGEQIAAELMHRDYSVYDATDYSIYHTQEEQSPTMEITDLLSERDFTNITLDQWIEIYQHANKAKEEKEKIYQREISNRPPHEICYTDIEVSLGVPWVDINIIEAFVYHILGKEEDVYNDSKYVSYELVTGSWNIRNKGFLGGNNTNAEVKYGLKRYNALFILEASLNLREIRLYDRGTIYNERDTLAALEKQKLIQEEFKKWIWEDEDRRWQVEEAYNQLFSRCIPQHYDGSHLDFPEMNPEYTLFSYQKDAVQKIIESRNTLLAFDVGAGKTFIMIAAAMKMRKDGISRKNMFVVPNHIVGQWEKIFSELYPNTKVLAIEPKMYKPVMRNKILRQIQEGDYDGIIIAYSCFEMIPLSVNAVLDNMSQQLGRLEDALEDLRKREGYCTWGEAPISREKQYIRKLTQDFLQSMDNAEASQITFDMLEINTLFVDEAHNYKNIPIRTKLKNLNGINTKGSSKCLDLLHKIRWVQQNNGGRGAVLATGTPLCNSIADAYAMQMYLQYEELQKSHLDVFDNWVKTFALPEQLCEIDVDISKYRFVRRFVKFFNLPELSRMFSEIAVFYAVNDKAKLPEFRGYTDVVIEKYDELAQYMLNLCERTEKIRTGEVDKKFDNMLKVSTDGRKAALDLQLVGRRQPYNRTAKTYNCVKNVVEIYEKYPSTTQLIFCDYSTPKGTDFSVYKGLKEKLVEEGIPEREIAFIHSYQTESRKVELFRKFNTGEMRILIGSTFKLGVGANVQVKLKAIHHLDVPWRPADMIQREGRIIRRGNENEDVLIYRYITEGSFDSYSWQILETKQRFISQFLSGCSYQRTMSDLETNVLTYAEVKALALSEPLMKQLAEKENEIKNLRILIAKETEAQRDMKDELEKLSKNLSEKEHRYQVSKEIAKRLSERKNEEFQMEYQKIKDALTMKVINGAEKAEKELKVMGMLIVIPEQKEDEKIHICLERDQVQYCVEMGNSANGNARRVINVLKKFSEIAEEDLREITRISERRKELKKMIEVQKEESVYSKQLRECEAEVSKLKKTIQI